MIKPKGFILVSVLLFLSLMTLFIMESMEASLLQVKLAQAFQKKQYLFSLAEEGLLKGETTLASEKTMDVEIRVTPLASVSCMTSNKTDAMLLNYYSIISTATKNGMSVCLASTYVPYSLSTETCKGIKPGRQSWRIMENEK